MLDIVTSELQLKLVELGVEQRNVINRTTALKTELQWAEETVAELGRRIAEYRQLLALLEDLRERNS